MKRFFTEHEKTLWLLLLFACMFFLGLEPLYTDCICNRK